MNACGGARGRAIRLSPTNGDIWSAISSASIGLQAKDRTGVLPVALDATALQLAPALNEVSFVRLDVRHGNERDRHLILHIAVRALRALQDLPQAAGKPVDELPDIPVRLFMSHAEEGLAGRSGGDSRGTRQGNPRDIGSIARPRLV